VLFARVAAPRIALRLHKTRNYRQPDPDQVASISEIDAKKHFYPVGGAADTGLNSFFCALKIYT
jgi:hypothetical protein